MALLAAPALPVVFGLVALPGSEGTACVTVSPVSPSLKEHPCCLCAQGGDGRAAWLWQ